MGRGSELLDVLCTTPNSVCSPTQKLDQPHHFEFLWRIHYVDVID